MLRAQKEAPENGRDGWIEREDFQEVPPKGYKRLFPGNGLRLKGGNVIECTGCARDAAGTVTAVHAKVIPGTKSGTPGADSAKAKAAITWVGVSDGVEAEVRLYDRLFTDPQPDAGGNNFLDVLKPDSVKVGTAVVEPSLAASQTDQKFQLKPRLLRGRPSEPWRGLEGGVQPNDGIEGWLGKVKTTYRQTKSIEENMSNLQSTLDGALLLDEEARIQRGPQLETSWSDPVFRATNIYSTSKFICKYLIH